MIITNNNNLPSPVYNAVCSHEHRGGDYSASMLYKSPRQVWLGKRHDEEIEKDASDMIWALLGTSLHSILEEGTGDNDLTEEYMQTSVLERTLSGSSDLLTEVAGGYKVSDYKVISVWSIIYESSMKDWTKQLNTYAYLFSESGFEIKKLEIVAFIRDWQKSKSLVTHNYPKSQVQVINIPLWSKAQTEKYITDRIALFESYRDISDDELPECTREELWQTDDVWAIKKEGRKGAVKLHNSAESANKHLDTLDNKHSIEHRVGIAKRCDYCDGKQFCSQYKSIQGE